MNDVFSLFPRDSEGRMHGGPFKFIAHDDLPAAIELGWRPLVPNENLSCHHDAHAVLCAWTGEGPMRLPE